MQKRDEILGLIQSNLSDEDKTDEIMKALNGSPDEVTIDDLLTAVSCEFDCESEQEAKQKTLIVVLVKKNETAEFFDIVDVARNGPGLQLMIEES